MGQPSFVLGGQYPITGYYANPTYQNLISSRTQLIDALIEPCARHIKERRPDVDRRSLEHLCQLVFLEGVPLL